MAVGLSANTGRILQVFFPLFLTLILQCRVHRKAAELAATLKIQYVRFDLSFILIEVKILPIYTLILAVK